MLSCFKLFLNSVTDSLPSSPSSCVSNNILPTHTKTHPHTGFYQVARKQKTLTVDEVIAKSLTPLFLNTSLRSWHSTQCTQRLDHTTATTALAKGSRSERAVKYYTDRCLVSVQQCWPSAVFLAGNDPVVRQPHWQHHQQTAAEWQAFQTVLHWHTDADTQSVHSALFWPALHSSIPESGAQISMFLTHIKHLKFLISGQSKAVCSTAAPHYLTFLRAEFQQLNLELCRVGMGRRVKDAPFNWPTYKIFHFVIRK